MASNNTERTKLKKGAWSPEEDEKLIAYIRRYGIWNWNHMPKPAGKFPHISSAFFFLYDVLKPLLQCIYNY